MTIEESFVMISALQHLAYCPRQFALIHVEKQWLDDGATARGQLAHQRVDRPGADSQGQIRTERSVWLANNRLRIRGIADMVEYSKLPSVPPCPVEMKSGKHKQLHADKIQLCAQALCLEEAHGCDLEFGFLSYKKSGKRIRIDFDEGLRATTLELIAEAHLLIDTGSTPSPNYSPNKCDRCSLLSICQPETLGSGRSARDFRDRMAEI